MDRINWTLVADVVKAFSWPLAAILAVWWLRRPLTQLLAAIAQRARKVSVFDVAFELEPLPELRTSWSAASADVRQLTSSQLFDSGSQTLFKELLSGQRADYAVIDLRSGQEWLTSRLFLFAVVLGEARGLRAFVFLEKDSGTRRRFLGTATPTNVRRRLGSRYPWFEEAFAKALSTASQPGSPFAATESWRISQFAQNFVQAIQIDGVPTPDQEGSYLKVKASGPTPEKWEHTDWLDGERLEQDLGDALSVAYIEDSPDIPPEQVSDALLRRKSQFVAVVDSDRRFMSLVDRSSLMEQRLVTSRGEKKDSDQKAS